MAKSCSSAVVAKETLGLVIGTGKQAIDDDANQTGQMLAALTDLPRGDLREQGGVAGGKAEVTREIDGGLETLSVSLPGHRHERPGG